MSTGALLLIDHVLLEVTDGYTVPAVLSKRKIKRVQEHPEEAKLVVRDLLPDADVTQIIGGTVPLESVEKEEPDCEGFANCCFYLAKKCDGMSTGFCPEDND